MLRSLEGELQTGEKRESRPPGETRGTNPSLASERNAKLHVAGVTAKKRYAEIWDFVLRLAPHRRELRNAFSASVRRRPCDSRYRVW